MLWDVNNPRAYNNRMGRYKTQAEWEFIQRHLPDRPLRILDIGGSSGRFALPLAELGHHVTVIDIAENALAILREKGHPNIAVHCGDVLQFEPDFKFDAALAIESAVYINLPWLLAKVNSLLAGGAPFLFTHLNRASWRYFAQGLLNRGATRYPIYTPSELRVMIEAANFRVEAVMGFVWMPFRFNSNSPLVSVFAAAERVLGLRRWIHQSPWLFYAARKR
ncbi:MAG: class I SAM-dependent methyltransferase [Candidatus Hydrogenedentota bacterium]